jgi:3',5'-cyclic-AMP phosphodiesterase
MRVTSIDMTPVAEIQHLAAAGEGRAASRRLPVLRGTVDALPSGLDALVLASDLQGVAELEPGDSRLLGEVVAARLAAMAKAGAIPPCDRTGVLLAGDLFSAPAADVRGASGDVRSVWRAFARYFRWVAGVAGNHDTFGAGHDRGRSFHEPGIHLLDGTAVKLDGLNIAGVGGIAGDATKPGRRDEREFVRELKRMIAGAPDVVVLHHGPDAQRGELRGHPEIRRAFDRSGPLLVVCGHVYWPQPTTDLRGGAQALNVDSRVVVLQPVAGLVFRTHDGVRPH